jgi:GNAT superfamily N-acetyltransferase
MRYLGGYDSDIHTSPVDFICVRDPDIVGVISGFLSKQGLYRCRGIYVRPEHRGQGISRLLFAAAEQQAVARGCLRMWSFPRHDALPSYLAYGFRQTSGWRWSGEWGPNCYVIKAVEKSATTTKNRL